MAFKIYSKIFKASFLVNTLTYRSYYLLSVLATSALAHFAFCSGFTFALHLAPI